MQREALGHSSLLFSQWGPGKGEAGGRLLHTQGVFKFFKDRRAFSLPQFNKAGEGTSENLSEGQKSCQSWEAGERREAPGFLWQLLSNLYDTRGHLRVLQ